MRRRWTSACLSTSTHLRKNQSLASLRTLPWSSLTRQAQAQTQWPEMKEDIWRASVVELLLVMQSQNCDHLRVFHIFTSVPSAAFACCNGEHISVVLMQLYCIMFPNSLLLP